MAVITVFPRLCIVRLCLFSYNVHFVCTCIVRGYICCFCFCFHVAIIIMFTENPYERHHRICSPLLLFYPVICTRRLFLFSLPLAQVAFALYLYIYSSFFLLRNSLLSTIFCCTHGVVLTANPIRTGKANRATLAKAKASAPTLARSSESPKSGQCPTVW